jgi:hypothetical protein
LSLSVASEVVTAVDVAVAASSARATITREATVFTDVTNTATSVPTVWTGNLSRFSAAITNQYRRVAKSNKNAPFPISKADAGIMDGVKAACSR